VCVIYSRATLKKISHYGSKKTSKESSKESCKEKEIIFFSCFGKTALSLMSAVFLYTDVSIDFTFQVIGCNGAASINILLTRT